MKKRIAVLACVGVVLLGAVCFLLARRRSFPEWEKAEEIQANSNASLTFLELKRDKEYDYVVANLRNDGEYVLSYYAYFSARVDYLKDGNWYTVYCSTSGPSVDMGINPHQEFDVTYQLPRGLLDTPGKYRIFANHYDGQAVWCEIDRE